MAKRLTELHPASIAARKVFELMDSLGVSLSYGAYGETTIKHNNVTYYLRDNDFEGNTIDSFPPELEYKIITIDPEDE